MKRDLYAALRAAAVSLAAFTVLTGIVYPLVILAIGRGVSPGQHDLIGQAVSDPTYFWGRPSAGNYNAAASAATNLAPSNPALREAVAARIKALHDADPTNTAPVPVDLVTSSASGLDPDISPAAAFYQAPRIARARNLPLEDVRALIEAHVEGRTLGILGEPRINVRALNRALDSRAR